MSTDDRGRNQPSSGRRREVAFGQVHDRVDPGRLAFQTCLHDQRVLRRRPVDKHRCSLTETFPLPSRDDPLLKRHEPLSPLLLDRLRHSVSQAVRACALFMGVRKHADMIEPDVPDEGGEFREILVGFAWETPR